MSNTGTRIRKGHTNHIDWVLILGFAVLAGFGSSDVRAELIIPIENAGSSQLRGLIDDQGTFYSRLLSWTEFEPVNIVVGAQANSLVSDEIEHGQEEVPPESDLILAPSTYQGSGGTSSSSTSTSGGSVPPVYAALLTLRSALPDPVLLLHWRRGEFLQIPDAPSSGLFRPPRQLPHNFSV